MLKYEIKDVKDSLNFDSLITLTKRSNPLSRETLNGIYGVVKRYTIPIILLFLLVFLDKVGRFGTYHLHIFHTTLFYMLCYET